VHTQRTWFLHLLFNYNVFHAMTQNDVDQLISGIIAFSRQLVNLRQVIVRK